MNKKHLAPEDAAITDQAHDLESETTDSTQNTNNKTQKESSSAEGTLSSTKGRIHLVIAGGGFAGVYTYKSLPSWVKKQCDITVIDRHNHFLFTPLLPEVAGASLDEHHVVEPLLDILDSSTTFIQSEILAMDSNKQTITLSDREISYDICVLGIGSTTQFFETKGTDTFAYTLKDLEDARILRNRFIDVLQEASQTFDIELRKKLLSFVIVGGGATGVELAGEAAELLFNTLSKQYKNIYPKDISLCLVNAGPNILNIFDKDMQEYATGVLARDRISVRNNTRIAEVTAEGVMTNEEELIPGGTVIWAAGVRPNDMTCTAGGFEIERGRICINEFLEAKGAKNLFILGDIALFPTEDGRGLPMTAQVAKQQGTLTGKNIVRMMKEKELQPFVYKEKGLLASIGSYNAVAQLGAFKFKGVIAWFIWRTVYLFNFASWKKRFKIMLDWTMNLFSSRDITRL